MAPWQRRWPKRLVGVKSIERRLFSEIDVGLLCANENYWHTRLYSNCNPVQIEQGRAASTPFVAFVSFWILNN